MVGIYIYENGLQCIAVSENEDTAINALYQKFAKEYDKTLTPREWWETNRKERRGAPRCFEIQPIAIW